jgi:hypothetical protein
MPDTLLRKDPTELARDAGAAVVTAGTRVKDGITNNRTEMLILLGTIGFVLVMTLLGLGLLGIG